MSYQLKIDEIMEALNCSAHPRAAQMQRQLEDVTTLMANELATHLGIACGAGSFEGLGFAGTCVPFFPATRGQALPDVFESNGFDDEAEWSDDDAEPEPCPIHRQPIVRLGYSCNGTCPLDTPSLDTSFHDHEMDV